MQPRGIPGKMMSRQTYQSIVSMLEEQPDNEKRHLRTVSEHFPNVSRETLLSIYAQHYQLQMKRLHPLHSSHEAMRKHYSNYTVAMQEDTPNVLLNMAAATNLSPTLFARIVLEQYITEKGIADASATVSQWIKDVSLITDPKLQQHVQVVRHHETGGELSDRTGPLQCILNDTNYGPLADNIKHSVGLEYEWLMKEKLQMLGVPYLDEAALRRRGYDKTPDFKLEVPILVGGYPVNWVESKASFGDEISHGKFLEDQFWSYQNRFGPGLVVYWFGFIEELDTTASQGILLADSFPSPSTICTAGNLYDNI